VDRALSSVHEGLLLFGLGSKSNGIRRKSKKNLKKKMRRLRWVQKAPKPNPSESTAELAMLPKTRSTSAMGSSGPEKSPTILETTGGLSLLPLTSRILISENQTAAYSSRPEWGTRPENAVVSLEDGMGPAEMMGSLPERTLVAGGSSSSLEVPTPASFVSQPELSTRPEISVLGPEAKLIDPIVLAKIPTISEDAFVVWAGLGPSGSLVASDSSSSVSSLVSGPITHTLLPGLGFKNGLELDLIPDEEPSPQSSCPIDKVKGFFGKGS
jgi:hypothetical protein